MPAFTIAKTVEIKKKFMQKEEAMSYFGFQQKSKRTFGRYLAEFKLHEEFGDGYINPTGGLVLIDIKRFEEFLRWKDENKYK